MKAPKCPHCHGRTKLKDVVSNRGSSLYCPHCNNVLLVTNKWLCISILETLFAFISGAVIRYLEYRLQLPFTYTLPLLLGWFGFLVLLANISWGRVTFVTDPIDIN